MSHSLTSSTIYDTVGLVLPKGTTAVTFLAPRNAVEALSVKPAKAIWDQAAASAVASRSCLTAVAPRLSKLVLNLCYGRSQRC